MCKKKTLDTKETLKNEWQKRHRTGCVLLIMSISVVAYVVLIGVSLFNTKIVVSGDPLIDLIIRLSFLLALSLMTGFWLRFLGRTYSEIQQDNLRMSSKILDAYNALLEDEVKNEKSHNKKDDKAKAEVDCNKTKIQQESSK